MSHVPDMRSQKSEHSEADALPTTAAHAVLTTTELL